MKKINSFLLALLTYVTAKAQVDTLEFPIGYSTNSIQTPIQQLRSFPEPRYKKGHKLYSNVNYMDPVYFGGWHQKAGFTDAQVVKNQADIQRELAQRFNYMINVTWFDGAYNDTCVAIANAHPEWKVAAMTLRAQTGTKIWKQDFTNDHYLQNSSGQLTGWYGELLGVGQMKTWSPRTNAEEYSSDGEYVKGLYSNTLRNLIRNVDLVSEDGEIYPPIESNGLLSDPACVAEMNQLKITWSAHPEIKWAPYLAYKVALNDKAYSSKFMGLPQFYYAYYTEYALSGSLYNEFLWEQSRTMQSKINGQYYSTEDFYVKYPWNWKDWYSAWHGLRWFSLARYYEMQAGDKLFSPFVSAGWDCNEENNVRPAQWLGLLKIMGIWGAEFYYTGFFNESATNVCEASGYTWQAVIPPLAQGVTSQYEDILRNGQVMDGDIIDNGNPLEPTPKYQFSTGDVNKLVMARKLGNEYVVLGIIENSSNVKGSTPYTSTATFTMDGEQITLPIARQGKTFRYNKVTKSLRLLDGWHEPTHPERWSKDYSLEAELPDSTNGTYNTLYYNGSTDWRSFKTTILLNQNQCAYYTVTPRIAETKYLFVKGTGSGNLQTTFDGTFYNLAISTDGWYKVSLGTVTNSPHTLTFTSGGMHVLDSICVTGNDKKYPVNVCTPPSAVISASNPAPCNGDSVMLSANTNVSYQWSTGEKTQSINIKTNGSYTVTVSNGQCSSASQPYIATFIQCADCRPATNLHSSNFVDKNFYLFWDRVEGATKYTVYIYDVTAKIYLEPRIKPQRTGTVLQLFVGKVKGTHVYEAYIIADCDGTNSLPSQIITIKKFSLERSGM